MVLIRFRREKVRSCCTILNILDMLCMNIFEIGIFDQGDLPFFFFSVIRTGMLNVRNWIM